MGNWRIKQKRFPLQCINGRRERKKGFKTITKRKERKEMKLAKDKSFSSGTKI